MTLEEAFCIVEFILESKTMYGYVFLTTNLKSGKKYIGARRSVLFDKNYFGELEEIAKDVHNEGPQSFSVKMLMPYESEEALVAGEKYFLDEYKALSDSTFYNCADEAPKKSRKKKAEIVDE